MEDLIQDDDFEIESNEELIPKTLDEDLNEWLEGVIGEQDLAYQATLYKYLNASGGSRKEMAGEWSEEIPTRHECGQEFGSGRYQMIVRFPEKIKGKRIIRSYKFRIHKSYDKEKSVVAPQVQQQIQFDPNLQMQNTMSIVKELVAMVASMKPAVPEPAPQIGNNIEMINDIIKQSAKSSIETHKELMVAMKEQTINNSEDEEKDDKMAQLLQVVAPLLETYLPQILGSGAQSKIVTETVKALPAFKQIIKSKKDLAKIIEHSLLKNGKEKTIKLLKKLKIKPASVPAKYKPLLLGKA